MTKSIQLDNLLVVVVVVVHPAELWPSRQGLAAKSTLHLLLSSSAGYRLGLLISILSDRVCALISLSGKRVVPLLISKREHGGSDLPNQQQGSFEGSDSHPLALAGQLCCWLVLC